MGRYNYLIVDLQTNSRLASVENTVIARQQAIKFSHDKKIQVTNNSGEVLAAYYKGRPIKIEAVKESEVDNVDS